MKKILLFLFILFASTLVFAQEGEDFIDEDFDFEDMDLWNGHPGGPGAKFLIFQLPEGLHPVERSWPRVH